MMEVVHRIGVMSSPEVCAELSRIGVAVPDSGAIAFEVSQTDRRWENIKQWIEGRAVSDVVTTRFTPGEIEAAEALRMQVEWLHGYPQPREDSFGYLQATYDLSEYCARCGIGMRQRAPFQIRSEPKWSRRDMFMLNWVFDEIFVHSIVYSSALMPLGIGFHPVYSARGVQFASVAQLDIRDEVDIVVDELDFEACVVCGRRKYSPHKLGKFPRLISPMSSAIARTRQWFGSGGSAFREIIVDQSVRISLQASGARGAVYWPVEGSV